MDQISTMDIFLPDHFVKNCVRHVLLGCFQIFNNYVQANCVLAMNIEDWRSNTKNTISLLRNETGNHKSWKSGIIGVIRKASKLSYVKKIHSKSFNDRKNLFFVIDVKSFDRLAIKELWLRCQPVDTRHCRIIIYNAYNLLSSHLILHEDKSIQSDPRSCGNRIIAFLRNTSTSKQFADAYYDPNVLCIGVQDEIIRCERNKQKRNWIFDLFIQISGSFALVYTHLCVMLSFGFGTHLKNTILLSSVGQQLHRRLFHIYSIAERLQRERSLPLCTRNLMSSIAFDLLCGWIFTYMFWHSYSLSIPLQYVLNCANAVVNELQQLVHWLMGVPAGLKLNLPLNTALGHFFLYHIYLWKTYMMVVRPIFSLVLESSVLLGMLGVTFVICLFNDVLSLATIHIYCFYGYASRIYGYQIGGLSALWRLFRGRKWNPLRLRVDSFTYDYNQLYVGTLIFTLWMFLLPTVLAYYFVFMCLRIVVLTIQGIVTRCINILGVFPLYIIILRLCDSPLTTGDIYFQVMQEEEALILSMKFVQIPMISTIKRTFPEDKHYEQPLSWKTFLHCLIWGKIIYPI